MGAANDAIMPECVHLCVLSLAKHGNFVARSLDTKNVSYSLEKHFHVSKHKLCVRHNVLCMAKLGNIVVTHAFELCVGHNVS